MGAILRILFAAVTWPANRFAGSGRTYDLSIPPADARAVIRGGVSVDPLFRRVSEGNAQSVRLEVVGRVWDRRFEIYLSGKFASGIGLVGTVEETPSGSQVITKVGWTGPFKWVMPSLTVVAVVGVIAIASDAREEIVSGSDEAWGTLGLLAMGAGGQLANLMTRGRRARHDDLPKLFEQLERVLVPYRR
jgi:hypothetical protein